MRDEFAPWQPSERQLAFMRAQEDEVLYGGAKGGGKSDALIAIGISRRIKYPRTNGLILRKNLNELSGAGGLIERAKDRVACLGEFCDWKERKSRFEFSNGSMLEFGYCERDEDVGRYMGREYADIGIDQVEEFSEFMWQRLRGENRTSVPGVKAVMRASANPGGVGFLWVKKTFIDPAPLGGSWRFDLPENQFITRAFIPAKLDDNPHLGLDYRKNLLALPDKERQALLEGRWDVFTGQFFDQFTHEKCVGELVIPPHAQIYCGIDYGFTAPFCCLWIAIFDGSIYVFDEVYETNLIDEDQAQVVIQKSMEIERATGLRVLSYYADPSVWNARSETRRSIADIWTINGLHATRANNQRIFGWSIIRSAIHNERFKIHPRCENLIRTMPQMVRHKRNVEDLDTKQEDHACDACRYGLADISGIMNTPRPRDNSMEYRDIIRRIRRYQHERDYGSGVGTPEVMRRWS